MGIEWMADEPSFVVKLALFVSILSKFVITTMQCILCSFLVAAWFRFVVRIVFSFAHHLRTLVQTTRLVEEQGVF